jgi:hypothetical protein
MGLARVERPQKSWVKPLLVLGDVTSIVGACIAYSSQRGNLLIVRRKRGVSGCWAWRRMMMSWMMMTRVRG